MISIVIAMVVVGLNLLQLNRYKMMIIQFQDENSSVPQVLLSSFSSSPQVRLSSQKNIRTNKSQQQSNVLNIYVDDKKSCPSGCSFIHTFLPDNVRFKYKVFHNDRKSVPIIKKDDNSKRGRNGTEHVCHINGGDCIASPFHVDLENVAKKDPCGHVLIVTRKYVAGIAAWAKMHRERCNVSVGLFLMADEKLRRHEELERSNLYGNFDYVFRNYYFPQPRFGEIPLRALGNATCGTDLPLPSTVASKKEPRWGLHWMFLLPHEHHIILRRSETSIYPTSLRQNNCTFKGWTGYGEGQKARRQLLSLSRDFPDLNCNVTLQDGFAENKESKFHYLASDVGESRIGFNPRGVHPECHRLPELLSMGTVPAMVEEEYMGHTFEPIPGILGPDWNHVLHQVRYYLSDEGLPKLEALSQDGARWMSELSNCIRGDIELILRGAFSDYETTSGL
jgi:hypothetical protein